MKNQPLALYQKIKQSLIQKIESGQLKPDDRVPSETQLARQFNASRMTANRALKELAEAKRIIRIQGLGTFVARPKPEAALLKIRSIAQEIQDWGGVHSSEVILLRKESIAPELAPKLDLSPGDAVFHSILVHKDHGVPVQYSQRYVNPAVAPAYLDQDFTQITPSEYLLEVAPVQEAEHSIEAIRPAPDVQNYLEIDHDEPCLRLTRRTWALDRAATYSLLISPGSRYILKGRFYRK